MTRVQVRRSLSTRSTLQPIGRYARSLADVQRPATFWFDGRLRYARLHRDFLRFVFRDRFRGRLVVADRLRDGRAAPRRSRSMSACATPDFTVIFSPCFSRSISRSAGCWRAPSGWTRRPATLSFDERPHYARRHRDLFALFLAIGSTVGGLLAGAVGMGAPPRDVLAR